MVTNNTEPPSSGLTQQASSNEASNERLHRSIRYQHFRRRERIKTKVGVLLIVYACILIILGYLMVEVLKMAKG